MLLIWADEPALVVAALFVAFVAFIAWRRGPLFQIIGKHLLADRIFIILLAVAAIPFVFLPNPSGQTIPAACSTLCIAQLRGAVSAGAKNCGAPADAPFRHHGCHCAGIADRTICGRSCASPEPFAVDRG